MKNLFIGCHWPITKLLCFFNNLLLQIKKRNNTRKFRKKRGSKGNPRLELFDPLLCRSARVFIGDLRRRVPVQLSHENPFPALSIRPRKRGYSHDFTARSFSRGLLWSVHLGTSFWILHSDPRSWEFGITLEASYQKSEFEKDLVPLSLSSSLYPIYLYLVVKQPVSSRSPSLF